VSGGFNLIFEDKCFNCPVRVIIEGCLHERIKEFYRDNKGASCFLPCGGVFQPSVQSCGKSAEFFQGPGVCALDKFLLNR